jgi:PAS domain S-box-containing protein
MKSATNSWPPGNRFAIWAEAALDGLALVEGDQIVQANPQFAGLFGYALTELTGVTLSALLVADSSWEKPLADIFADRQFHQVVGIKKGGYPFHLEVRGKAVACEGRNAVLVLARTSK